MYVLYVLHSCWRRFRFVRISYSGLMLFRCSCLRWFHDDYGVYFAVKLSLNLSLSFILISYCFQTDFDLHFEIHFDFISDPKTGPWGPDSRHARSEKGGVRTWLPTRQVWNGPVGTWVPTRQIRKGARGDLTPDTAGPKGGPWGPGSPCARSETARRDLTPDTEGLERARWGPKSRHQGSGKGFTICCICFVVSVVVFVSYALRFLNHIYCFCSNFQCIVILFQKQSFSSVFFFLISLSLFLVIVLFRSKRYRVATLFFSNSTIS